MQIIELLKKSTEYLDKKGIENPRVEAETFLCKTLGCKRIDLYADFEKVVTEDEKETLRGFLRRRIGGEPLQYITGSVGFRFIELDVKEDIFIPRPETEILVQLVLDCIKNDASFDNPAKDNINEDSPKKHEQEQEQKNILEIGTGTGAIAISLVKEANCKVTATDINKKALELAKINAEKEGLNNKICFIESRFFDDLPKEKYDLIVSNPPYVAEKFKESLPVDVMREPHEALFSGTDGLNAVKEIFEKASQYLVEGGTVILEISPEQGENVLGLAESVGFSDTYLEKDLSGRVRFVRASNGNCQNKKE
jgi:release factor glutamine methyltransferase